MPDTVEFNEGSLLKQSFEDIWQRGFRKYRQAGVRGVDPGCNQCKDWSKCRGGCYVMRLDNRHCIRQPDKMMR